MSGANVTAQHERRRAIGPAFENVWTTCFLANCMQVQAVDQLEHVVLIRRITQADLEPFRLGLPRLGISNYSKFAGQLCVFP